MEIELKRRELIAAALALPLLSCGGGGGGGGSGAADVANANISIDSSKPGAQMDSSYAGLSYEKSKLTVPLFSTSNLALVRLFKLLGPSILRLGGNSVDKTTWNGLSGLPAITSTQVDNLADFLTATGWRVIYGINLAQNNATSAAAEASYVAGKMGSSLIGFEIGNEPDIYPTNGLRPSTYTYADYRQEWEPMALAVRAAVPGCVLIGPATGSDDAGYSVPFAQDEAGTIAMLTQHYYRANGLLPIATLDLLLSPDVLLTSRVKSLVSAAAGLPMGFRMGECNSFSRGGALNISNTYGTALWMIEYLFTLALLKCNGANFHGGGNTAGYTPIADNNGVIEGPRPDFYGIKLFSEAAQGTAVPATITYDQTILDGSAPLFGGSTSFDAYGVARTDGGVNVMLVNKNPKYTIKASVNVGSTAHSALTMTMSAPGLTSTSGVRLNGAAIQDDGNFVANYVSVSVTGGVARLDVPPLTAILVKSA